MLTQMALTSSWHTHIPLPHVYHQLCAERMPHISFILHSYLNLPSCSRFFFFYKADWAKCVEKADLWTGMGKSVRNYCSRGNSVILFRAFLTATAMFIMGGTNWHPMSNNSLSWKQWVTYNLWSSLLWERLKCLITTWKVISLYAQIIVPCISICQYKNFL